jgi:chemotaxis signal transduction protein
VSAGPNGQSRMGARAAALASEFDETFARLPAPAEAGRIELLWIRIGADRHAIRLSQIAGLYVDRPITRVPGPLAELCGVVSLRGSLLPVYDLRPFFGHAPGPPPRWLVVAADAPVGLAFEQLDGHAVVAENSIASSSQESGRPARQIVEGAEGGRAALLHIPSITAEIAARVRRARPSKER